MNVRRTIRGICLGIIIFVGLPMLGWGVGDIRGFLTNPARLFYVIGTIILQFVIVVGFPHVSGRITEGEKTVARQRLALAIMQILSIAIVVVGPFCDRRGILVMGEALAVRYAGIGLVTVGIVWMTYAQAYLGRMFSFNVTIQKEHELVTTGPFKYIRHPRYLGIIVFTHGLALVFRSWLAVMLCEIFIVVLLWRIFDEEKLMREEFGEKWRTYFAKSSRLIPGVW